MRKLVFLMALSLAGCAQPIFNPSGADTGLTPSNAVPAFDSARGRRVIWGGEVVESRNLAHSTELVVLGRPLNTSQRPLPGRPQQGRFIVRYPGYLETMAYQPGRLVTIEGHLADRQQRRVGQAEYLYPVVAADSIYLWPEREGQSNVRFGVGVGIGIHL